MVQKDLNNDLIAFVQLNISRRAVRCSYSMASVPNLTLNSAHGIPQLGFGTFDAPKEVVTEAVEVAIGAGFRHIDCAMFYHNEPEVGTAIAASMKKHNLNREDIFVTSKLWCDKHAPGDVRKTCERSIKDLGVQYLDLYLIHWPVSFQHKEGLKFDISNPSCIVYENHKLEDTWKAMEELVFAGLVKSIGVSNFNKRQIERILASCIIPPAVNQVEVNIHWLNTKLIEFCHSKNIQVEAYAPFGSPGFMKGQAKPLLQEENVVEIAHKHKKTPAQVLLRHGLQRGLIVLTKSVTPERIKSNFDVFDFELTDAEMEKLNKTSLNKRLFAVPINPTLLFLKSILNIRSTRSINCSAAIYGDVRDYVYACRPLLLPSPC
ncbi:1,5-anhydro-D-fructose reductase [Echinococcus granulosus]|uniref:Aldo keto reductase family 1 member B4 n=1 Tax=Echinococcus granulosus TaxID=6210 RepID=A0A068WU90_ECHGR|nr:1,5-anhydro-D-fructose reductase [Echinococcus granulosus]CDS21191.1 aldo keto reductase family 1 member B4 [Echinococcus granulosus]